MSFKKSLFKEVITSQFLVYSWVSLKSNRNFRLIYFRKKKFEAINNKWFIRTANLIKNGNYVYKNLKDTKFLSLSYLKNKIIENAILIYISSFLMKNLFLSSINFSLKEYSFELNLLNFFEKKLPQNTIINNYYLNYKKNFQKINFKCSPSFLKKVL